MHSILVGHSYFLRFDSKQFARAKPYPPLATLQAAALIRQAGHQVAVFDAMLAEGTQEFHCRLREVEPQLVLIYEDNFNFLSKMCLSKMRAAACEMIAKARSAGCRIIVAGSDASDAPNAYLQAGAEIVLLGEGLATLLAILERLASDPGLTTAQAATGLTGFAVLTADGTAVCEAGTNVLPTPQQPAMPAWDLIDVERYRHTWREAHGFFSLNIAASRGCPFRCNWCAKPIWGNRYLQRKPSEVAAETAHLKRTFGAEHIWFADDIFGFRPAWVREFAACVRADNGVLPFTIQTRADLISQDMAAALAEAGCAEAWIGAESGSQRILDAMNKGTTPEEILRACARLRAHRIRVCLFIQIGYLGEQLEDLLATVKLIELAQPDEIGVSVSYPLPGTPFYEKVKAQLGSKTRWSDSGDLAMMFRGTYSSEFYRAARDLLHEQVVMQNLQRADAGRDYPDASAALRRRWNVLAAKTGSAG